MSSSSTSSSHENSCHLTWSIPDIVTKIASPNAIQLCTSFPSKLKSANFKFQLQAIPAYNGHVQIQLVLIQTKQSLNLSFKLSIIGEGGQTGPSEVGKAKCSEKDSNILLAKIMISHDDLTSAHSHLLTNGKLKIFGEVILLPIEAESHGSTESISTSISIVENLETLLRSGQFSDAVLVVGGQELKVHKSILVRSPLFATMFQHSDTNQESQISRVEIVDVTLDVLEAFLLYLYTDKVDSLDHYAWELLSLADKWPIFLDNGHLCLKLNTFESLLTDFPIWIDSMYRIRLGNFDLNSKKNVHFSMMKIMLPRTFEYDFTFSQDLNSNIGPAGCATSDEKLELEKYRHRLCQLNPEHRALMEKEALNYEQLELQLVNSILDNNKLVREKKKLELQQQYDNKLKEIDCVFSSKQKVEIDELKKSLSMKTKSETTNALKAIEADADFDINNFKNRLITKATEEVNLIWQKCNANIEEYSKIRNEARQKDLSELKMKMEIEIKQKELLIIQNIKEEKEKETVDATLDAKQAIANLNSQHDDALTKELNNNKLLLKKDFESKKARINKEFSKERTEIEELMEKVSITIKSKSLKRK